MMRALLLLLLCGAANAQVVVGVHTVSKHFPQHGQNNENGGIYARVNDYEGGYYRNSYGRETYYFGRQFNFAKKAYGSFDVGIGLATGYRNKCAAGVCGGASRTRVAFVATPSYTAPFSFLGVTPRVQYVPSVGPNSHVVHLSLEHQL